MTPVLLSIAAGVISNLLSNYNYQKISENNPGNNIQHHQYKLLWRRSKRLSWQG